MHYDIVDLKMNMNLLQRGFLINIPIGGHCLEHRLLKNKLCIKIKKSLAQLHRHSSLYNVSLEEMGM